jgi:hypothetical protein
MRTTNTPEDRETFADYKSSREGLRAGRERLVICSPRYNTFREGKQAYLYIPDPFGFIMAGSPSQSSIRAEVWKRMRHMGLVRTMTSPDMSRNPLEYKLDYTNSTHRVVPVESAGMELADMELFASGSDKPLKYAFLDELTSPGETGKCIPNVIFNTLAGKPRFKRLTRRVIDDQIEQIRNDWRDARPTGKVRSGLEKLPGKGVTTNEAVQWCKRFGKGIVGLLAVEPLRGKVITKYDASETTLYRIAYIIKDEHAHAITEQGMKASVSLTDEMRALLDNKLEFRIDGDAPIDTFSELDASATTGAADAAKFIVTDCSTKVILVHESCPPEPGDDERPLNSLVEIMTECAKLTGYTVTTIKYREDNVIGFREPKSGRVVLLAKDMVQVKRICHTLAQSDATFPVECTRFTNQTVGSLARNMCRALVGTLPTSTYNAAVHELMSNPEFSMKPLTGTFEDTSHGRAIDIQKCYSAAMNHNKTPYPVFDAFSDVTPFGPADKAANTRTGATSCLRVSTSSQRTFT